MDDQSIPGLASPRDEAIAALFARNTALHGALKVAIEGLEGWVAWKCPKRHLPEHEAFIGQLRAVLDEGA